MRAGTALLLLAALAGCTGPGPQACTEIGADTSVRVDTSALDLPAGATGTVCLGEECADADLGSPFSPEGVVSYADVVPDVPTVTVSVTLTDAAGVELWSASTSVDTPVVEPNGPGCDQVTVVPRLRSTPAGRLAP